MSDDDNITELAEATTRRRNKDVAKLRQRRNEIGLLTTAPYYGRQIPPPLNPCYPGWITLLIDGYTGLTELTHQFRMQIMGLASARKLDHTVTRELMDHFDELRGAVKAAAEVTEKWSPASNPDDGTIPPEVHQIADHAKYVYAVGSRDISWMQHRLRQLAYASRIDIEAHNELQRDLCYDMGDPIYWMTTSNLHDEETWDGGWDWDENTYSDGRQVMIRAQIPDWQQLFDEVPINYAIKVYGDGVINDHPAGTVCQIAPPVPQRKDDCGHPDIQISLADLMRQPSINIRWDAEKAAVWRQQEAEEEARRNERWAQTRWEKENAVHLEAEKFREEEA